MQALSDADCMKTIQKSVLLAHSARDMFVLVTDVPSYAQFLPWCDQSEVIQCNDDGMVAKIGMTVGGLRYSFTTRNRHVENRQVSMELVDGPFSHLSGGWDFKPLGDDAQRACKVEFRLSYDFSSLVLATLIGPVFEKLAGSLVDAFVKRADSVYRS